MAQKWDWGSGNVTSWGPKWVTVLSLLGAALVLVGALVILQWTGELARKNRRSYVGILTACAIFLAGAVPVLLRHQVGLTDPMLAPQPSWSVLVLGIGSIAYGILCAIVAGGASSTVRRG